MHISKKRSSTETFDLEIHNGTIFARAKSKSALSLLDLSAFTIMPWTVWHFWCGLSVVQIVYFKQTAEHSHGCLNDPSFCVEVDFVLAFPLLFSSINQVDCNHNSNCLYSVSVLVTLSPTFHCR